MHTTWISSPRRRSDRELIDRVRHIACHERRATACLVAHLAELDERRLYVSEGCPSLFVYCTEVLHLSEGAAYNRIEAARAARKFPAILEKLADGSVHLTGVRMLAQHLTEENHRDLLEQARHRSKSEIEKIIAQIRPVGAVPTRVRKIPTRASAGIPEVAAGPILEFGGAESASHHQPGSFSANVATAEAADAAGHASADVWTGNRPSAAPTPKPARVTALAPDMYGVQFTADAETYRLLCQARELLKHQIPDGDVGAVLGLALKVLVEKVAKQKLGSANKPRRRGRPVRQQSSRHIPAEVRRQVWSRDQGRCAFVASNGRRCAERGRLEFHHVRPFARGGPSTYENIQLRCRAHNAHEAEVCFGPRAGAGRRPAYQERPGTGPDDRRRHRPRADLRRTNSSRSELGYVMSGSP